MLYLKGNNLKSNFWSWKEFKSRHFRRVKIPYSGKSGWCGPVYFENPIDELEFRAWVRKTCKLNNSEKFEVRISNSDHKNSLAQSTWETQIKNYGISAAKKELLRQSKKKEIIKIDLGVFSNLVKKGLKKSNGNVVQLFA